MSPDRIVTLALTLLLVSACVDPDDRDGDGSPTAEDCDDEDATAHPSAEEVCDEVDNDCDGQVDEPDAADTTVWYADRDGDGWGDTSYVIRACREPFGFVARDGDCDDEDGAVFPGSGCDEAKAGPGGDSGQP